MYMYTDYEKQYLLKFLNKCYPVIRYKQGLHFKRAILTEYNIHYLSENDSYHRLRNELVTSLNTIFGFDEQFLLSVVDLYLPKKRKA